MCHFGGCSGAAQRFSGNPAKMSVNPEISSNGWLSFWVQRHPKHGFVEVQDLAVKHPALRDMNAHVSVLVGDRRLVDVSAGALVSPRLHP
jgi:hypothetical protein